MSKEIAHASYPLTKAQEITMKKGNAFLAVGFAILSVLFGKLGYDLYLSGRSGAGASIWPLIVCSILFTGSILVLIKSLMAANKEKSPPIFNQDVTRVLLSIAALGVYFSCVVWLGFFSSSFIMLASFIAYYGRYKWYICLLFASCITAVVYVVFNFLLNVSFEFGLLF